MPCEGDGKYPHRYIDEERPAPGQPGQDQASQAWAEHLADHDGHGGDADDAGHVPTGVARHHHLHHGRQQPTGDALEDAVSDQEADRSGAAAQHGANDKRREAAQEMRRAPTRSISQPLNGSARASDSR